MLSGQVPGSKGRLARPVPHRQGPDWGDCSSARWGKGPCLRHRQTPTWWLPCGKPRARHHRKMWVTKA